MSRVRRAILLTGSLAAMISATALLIGAGLPTSVTVIDGQRPTAPEIGALAPKFTLPSLDGVEFNLSEATGEPLLINFWATWCAPCRVEMPELQALFDTYGANQLRIVAVNTGEPPETVRDWVRSLGLTFDILLDKRGEVAALYRLRGQPTTYVISPSGVILDIVYGASSRLKLEAALAPYLSDTHTRLGGLNG